MAHCPHNRLARGPWRWTLLAALLVLSAGAPLALLLGSIRQAAPYRDFWALHSEELLATGVTALAAGALAMLIATGALLTASRAGPRRRLAAGVVYSTIFLAMFLPGSLIGVALLHLVSSAHLPRALREGWGIVSVGQAARLAGVALIVLQLARDARDRHLGEMASVDGATPLQAWRHVHLARVWPVALGAFVLVVMFAATELSATMVLLPAGVPNFAQSLLNQMHYLRDQQVIASCLALVAAYVLLAGGAGGLVWLWRRRSPAAALLLAAALLPGGCGRSDEPHQDPEVLRTFGRTGRGPGQFIYPRAVALAGDGTLYVVDKTGRVQHLTGEGRFLDGFAMPQIEAGKPTGLAVGPDGLIYVADTHYHRVMVFDPSGALLRQFGRFGEDDGCFIYPTDVAFGADGRIYVSEYGGNDRVSIFSPDGEFLSSFGTPGSEAGQLSRPAALRVDVQAGRVYVADACNHRVAVCDLSGRPVRYVGSVGGQLGQLRYPYDLALMPGGGILVCEYGNNRIQVFDAAGRGVVTYGGPGRTPGKLAYPWGVALDGRGRAFVVDAGNNRIQVWRP